MSKAKVKAIEFAVPQTKEAATAMLAEYGVALREVERIETDLNDELAAAKKAAVVRAAPFITLADAMLKGLQVFCEANRSALTDNNKIKTVDFGTGKVSWRWNPASVKPRGKIEDIIARIKALGAPYKDFLRATVELDKVAMLRNPNLAKKIEGIKIASAGETFTVEPFADEQLAESA